jgi:putative tricarboxylic transport membrane protein
MRRDWQIPSLAFAALFSAAGMVSFNYSLFDALGPGPGFFPFCLSVLGAAIAAAIFVHANRAARVEPVPILPEGAARRAGVAIVGSVALAAIGFEPLGFRLIALLFIAGLLFALGVRSVWAIGLGSLGGSFGVFHVFFHWLKLPLPIGPLGF